MEKTVAAHRDALRPPDPEPKEKIEDSTQKAADTRPVENRLTIRTRERCAAVHDLCARHASISAISRQLRLDRKTVQRFARAHTVDDVLVKARSRGTLLYAFKPYLHQRFNNGCTDAAQLTREITERGYHGSDQAVRRYLQPFRATLTPPPPVAATIRRVTGWLTRRPDALTEDERLELETILHRSDTLTTTYRHVRVFAAILTHRHGERLPGWMRDVQATGAPALRSFAVGLHGDLDAVTAGITLDYNSGAVEGTVNRTKMIKRQMYGRANLDLLRKRLLLAS